MQNQINPILIIDQDGIITTYTHNEVAIVEQMFMDAVTHLMGSDFDDYTLNEKLEYLSDCLMDGYWMDGEGINRVYINWPTYTDELEW